MKKTAWNIFAIALILSIFVGCNPAKKRVRKSVEEMMQNPVSLHLDQFQCRRNAVKMENSTLRMVVYVDSSECTPCALSKLRFWNPLIEEAKVKAKSISFIFIVAPNPSEIDEMNLELNTTDLQSSLYLDTAYVFRKQNPSIPNDRKYHSFMMDKDNKILFVGSPVDNEKIKSIYNKALGL